MDNDTSNIHFFFGERKGEHPRTKQKKLKAAREQVPAKSALNGSKAKVGTVLKKQLQLLRLSPCIKVIYIFMIMKK